eukprot:4939539-Pyramimonas_sp.AAC.1
MGTPTHAGRPSRGPLGSAGRGRRPHRRPRPLCAAWARSRRPPHTSSSRPTDGRAQPSPGRAGASCKMRCPHHAPAQPRR